ncbi:hypothetical protein E2C01_094830 [Portunus trituberculatus]|uniref:Uncharacterized protein n=1 Tax=Portunus trituberculatus TaxID=210409 RepID=A0A5B7K1X7_PORTR|nr:hypothetical protein [Portunus trituberculatus]
MEKKETEKKTKQKGGDGKKEERSRHKKRDSKKVQSRSSQTSELDLTKIPELAPLMAPNPDQNPKEDPKKNPQKDSNQKSSSVPSLDSSSKNSEGKGSKSRSIFDYKPSPKKIITASDPVLSEVLVSQTSEVLKGRLKQEVDAKSYQASEESCQATGSQSGTVGSRSRDLTCQPSTSRDATGNEENG